MEDPDGTKGAISDAHDLESLGFWAHRNHSNTRDPRTIGLG